MSQSSQLSYEMNNPDQTVGTREADLSQTAGAQVDLTSLTPQGHLDTSGEAWGVEGSLSSW